jgi:hypothetical protein
MGFNGKLNRNRIRVEYEPTTSGIGDEKGMNGNQIGAE